MALLFGEKRMKKYFKFSFWDYFLFIFFALGVIGFIVLPLQSENNKGIFYMLKKDHKTANEFFIKCLNNKQPVCRMNKALNHFFLKHHTESIKEYVIAKKYSTDKQFLFYTSFNAAVSAAAHQDRDLALKFYQDSLFYRPDSVETKTNIELLFKGEQNQKQSSKQKDQQDQDQKKQDQKKQNSSESDKKKKESQNTHKENQEKSEQQQEGKEQQKLEQQQEVREQQQGDGEQQKQEAHKINEKQMQAILKSILEQEKQILKKQQESKKRSPVLEKDW